MLDIKFIRENLDLIKGAALKKHIDVDLDELIRLDHQRTAILQEVEKMRAEQNDYSKKIAETSNAQERAGMIEQMRTLKTLLQKKEKELERVMEKWRPLMLRVPNVPDVSVPDGESDAGNLEVKVWGKIPQFSFKPKSHIELMEALNMVDFDRGAKVAGFRGYFLKGEAVRLTLALWQFVFDEMHKKGSFTPLMTPSIVRKEIMMGTGYLPQGEDDLYATQDKEYLIGTSEAPAMGYYMDEILKKEDLPVKFLGFSPCFRREAGAHGKDTKGVFRVHEFFKFEQVVLCEASHDESVKYHEELTENAESLLQALEIPYHVVINCGGDLGLGQVKKYDIEAWVPSENKYRETHSSSYFHDFQTRRLNIRYRDADGTLKFVHSLNNTALATPRILVSLIENNQQEDGSIKIPSALRKYVGMDVIKQKRL
ncbi:MAG: serine--tRNA ligase [bacterium]|nr:serine--tRNA ligase [bacterium]